MGWAEDPSSEDLNNLEFESQLPALPPYPAGELCHGREQSDEGEAEVAVDEGWGVLADLEHHTSQHHSNTARLGANLQSSHHHSVRSPAVSGSTRIHTRA